MYATTYIAPQQIQQYTDTYIILYIVHVHVYMPYYYNNIMSLVHVHLHSVHAHMHAHNDMYNIPVTKIKCEHTRNSHTI